MTEFDFTLDDLEANRTGVLSRRQQRSDRRVITSIRSGVFGLLYVWWFAVAVMRRNSADQARTLVTLAVIFVLIGWVMQRVLCRAAPPLDPPVVVSIAGRATIVETRERPALSIGGKTFWTTAGAEILEADQTYIAHYSAQSGRLRSVEIR